LALFGRRRDVLLINSINRELLPDIITQQIGYYKVTLGASQTNIYGEATDKFFSQPALLNCLVTRGDQAWSAVNGFGPDLNRTVSFAFFLEDLRDLQIVPEVGDVIFWYENYYEVDGVVDNQYFVGKIPEYSYSEGLSQFGSSISIICSTHLEPADKLGITKERM
jgi:hypothetical protein